MAQAKTKASQQSTRKRSGSSGPKRKSQPRARPRSQSQSKPRASQSSSNGQSKPAEVVGVVEEKAKVVEGKAKEAGKGVGRAVKRARVPLLASGAVIAGAAGGAALASRQARRHRRLAHSVGKIDSDDVAKAARRVGDVSARVGRFAADFQRARESSNGAGTGRHRSPVEVVLDGLTTRR